MSGKNPRLIEAIIDALDEDIFQREVLLFVRVPIAQGLEQFGSGIFFVHWHDLIAHGIGGAVQRNG